MFDKSSRSMAYDRLKLEKEQYSMDQKCNVKVRENDKETIKEHNFVKLVISEFVIEFLIRGVSIIIFRYHYRFYVDFTRV